MHTDATAPIPEQLSTAAVVFGLFSLAVCWWFPFGAVLGLCGTVLGFSSWITGGGMRAAVGFLLAISGAGAGLLLAADSWIPHVPF
ncbi:MAG TPA: hypothetical protein VN641_17635 [Urbifossiella sp.]|jgi:hypothetical protein|nr:hypothetical protein [Urbifossiella sp.]